MPTRYKRKDIIINRSDYYAPLRKSRDLRSMTHYGTVMMRSPSIGVRSAVDSTDHLWTYGDRLYNIAHAFYGDARYWWIIAWWNGYGMEADIKTGAVITIPINIEEALKALGF